MAGIDDDREKLKDFLIRDQFLSISHTELRMYLRDYAKETEIVHTLAQVADRYLQAHNCGFMSRDRKSQQKHDKNGKSGQHYKDNNGSHSKLTQNGGDKDRPANHSSHHGSKSNEKRGTGYCKDTWDKICENCNRNGHPQERCRAPGGPDYKCYKSDV